MSGCACADACACASVDPFPPRRNRPGLPRVAYRRGAHGAFLERMLGALHREALPDGPRAGARPLEALRTRAPDDLTLALLDAWATVEDVLTFYQERIANEGFLRTAQERRSVLELARAIGYELGPGVAAATLLAFSLETAAGAPPTALVPAGTRVMSVPGPGEAPQAFETSAPFVARREWNELRPARLVPETARGKGVLALAGLDTRLRAGDSLLVVTAARAEGPWKLHRVIGVTLVPEEGLTRVALLPPVEDVAALERPEVFAMRVRATPFGANAPEWKTASKETRAAYYPSDEGGDGGLADWPGLTLGEVGALVMGEPQPAGNFAWFTYLALDQAYPDLAFSLAVLTTGGDTDLYGVWGAIERSASAFNLTGRSSVAAVTGKNWDKYSAALRKVTIHTQSEPLALAMVRREDPLVGDEIVLDAVVPGLRPGMPVALTGKRIRAKRKADDEGTLRLTSPEGRTSDPVQPGDEVVVLAPPLAHGDFEEWRMMDAQGFQGALRARRGAFVWRPSRAEDEAVGEVAWIDGVSGGAAPTTLDLVEPLANAYDRHATTITANLVEATHGETVAQETLGSGDGARAGQRFTLKRPLLTHVAGASPAPEAALRVLVNDVAWERAPTLFDLGPRAEAYAVRVDDDGRATVQFGDGIEGARVPTGVENVVARYRAGLGLAGNVPARSLTLFATRPMGVKAVTNPVAAAGGEDPERLEGARANAPVQVLTLDRIVSRQDFEDFARAYPGVGKAAAVDLRLDEATLVHVTAADAAGNPLGTQLERSLVSAMDAVRDRRQGLAVDGHRTRAFRVGARLLVDPRRETDAVVAAAEAALREAFSFGARAFAQPVAASEVIATLREVPGVLNVALDDFDLLGVGGAPHVEPVLVALGAGVAPDGSTVGAELLLVDPASIDLSPLEETP